MANSAGHDVALQLDSIEAERRARIDFLENPDETVRSRFDQAVHRIDDARVRTQADAAWTQRKAWITTIPAKSSRFTSRSWVKFDKAGRSN